MIIELMKTEFRRKHVDRVRRSFQPLDIKFLTWDKELQKDS